MKEILLAAVCFSVLNVNAGQKPDLKKFFGVKSIKELPANVKVLSEQVKDGIKITSMKFDGGKINGKPTRIYAYYTRPAKQGRYPAVLNIHGAGLRVLNPDLNYPKYGFACLSIDWAGPATQRKVPRKPPFSEFEANGNMADKRSGKWKIAGVDHDGIRVGVIFARRALDFLRNRPEIDKNNIFTVGSSAGAHLSLILIGLEPNIKAAAVKYGNAYIRDLKGFYGGYFGPITLCSKAQQDDWLAHFDPKHVIKDCKPRVLLLSGTDDIFFWMPLVFKTYREIPSEKRLLMRPNDCHRLVGSEQISVRFFKEAMDGNLNGWPELSDPSLKEKNDKLEFTVSVKSVKKLKEVKLVYKLMPLPFKYRKSKGYRWETKTMLLSGGKWQASLPVFDKAKMQLVAYVNAEDIDGGIASSDTVEFPAWPRWRGLPGRDRKAPVAKGNLLGTYGQFEKKSGFHFKAKAAVDTSGKNARTGKGAALTFGGDPNLIAKGIPGTPGKKFLLKGWFKSVDPAGGSARVQINWNGSKPFKYNLKTPKITGEYQEIKLEGTIPPGTKSGVLIMTSPDKGMYIDDLEYYITD